jgi:two-component system chemotaxis response regulator CheB
MADHILTDGSRNGDPIPISCPECHGVLSLRVEGPKHHLVFVCRVQHTFSVIDLLTGKEDHLESRLWSALNLAEELAELTRQLARLAARQGLESAGRALEERAERAERQATELKRIIEKNRAVEVGDEVARIHAGDGR